MDQIARKLRKLEKLREKETRKDRLIQTRVDRRLHKLMVDVAKHRRVSVSNLVRNVLEDAFGERGQGSEPVHTDQAGHVYAWMHVTAAEQGACSRCSRAIGPGERGLIGLTDDPDRGRAWLCAGCGDRL